ncbi:MAG: hypothetical protein AAB019_00115, partial [Planctomycetota bacterium]
ELLILARNFHDVKPSYLEVAEEFRLFHNLFYDIKSGKCIKIDDNGDEEDVIIIKDGVAKIKLKQIRQFLAIKEMHLAIYFDIVRHSSYTLEELGLKEGIYPTKNDKLLYTLFVCKDSISNHKAFSRLLGKRLIDGVSKEETDFWSYNEEKKKQYADFIIGTDANGGNIIHTSDPQKLSNYFGANPGSPHYLTPVFFSRDVLAKYYSNPEKFSVSDGFLSCAGLWGVRIDNNHDKHIIVFLGDLGRDLHYKEQLYWKSFNIPPDGTISGVNWKRGFLAQPTNPEKQDLLFKYLFDSFQPKWQKKFGWFLFKYLSPGDSYLYRTLRIPLNNDQNEFDNQVLTLNKIIIDSLNEEEIEKNLVSKPSMSKGISKFELFLKTKNVANFESHIKFMRNLNGLRSGVGHRKGEDYDRAAKYFDLEIKELIIVFDDILKAAIVLLEYLNEQFLETKTPSTS